MNLLQELLDEVLGHLPPDGGRSLKSCSLVSRSWLDPSRRLLFANVAIEFETCERFLNTISPTNTDLLRHIHSLTYFSGWNGRHNPRYRVCTLQVYLPSLRQLQTLALHHMEIEPIISERPELFSAFQHTLSTLSFRESSITWRTFVSLVGYFPNLRNLEISSTSFGTDGKPIIHPSYPLRGRLWIENMWTHDMTTLVSLLPELRPQCEELVMEGDTSRRLLPIVQKSVKFLTRNRDRTGYPSRTPLDLSHCTELQEMRIGTTCPEREDVVLISSIASTNLERIVFASGREDLTWDSLSSHPCWPLFDDIVCGLVDRLRLLGYERSLEVEVWARGSMGPKKAMDDWEFLPKFREKGRVRILENTAGECYSPSWWG